ncbi:MAG: peroxiredoxin family protein [Saprospiraceae bacterium]
MTKLKEGTPAIPFKTTDLNGKVVNLSDYKGQKLLLTFFRKAACPFCNMGMRELIKKHKELENKGIKVISLFASSKEDVLKYAGKQNPPFPIIADGDFNIYEKYGVEVSYIGMMKTMLNPIQNFKAMTGGFFNTKSMSEDPVIPADFLIDEEQNIHRAYYGKDYDDHLSVAEVLAWN